MAWSRALGGAEGKPWILFQLSVVTTVGEQKSSGGAGANPASEGERLPKEEASKLHV